MNHLQIVKDILEQIWGTEEKLIGCCCKHVEYSDGRYENFICAYHRVFWHLDHSLGKRKMSRWQYARKMAEIKR